MDLTNLEYGGIPILLLNIAIVEGFKRMGINKKISGLLAIIIGLIEGLFLFSEGDIATGIVIGLALGLSSVGLYSSGKNTCELMKEDKEGD